MFVANNVNEVAVDVFGGVEVQPQGRLFFLVVLLELSATGVARAEGRRLRFGGRERERNEGRSLSRNGRILARQLAHLHIGSVIGPAERQQRTKLLGRLPLQCGPTAGDVLGSERCAGDVVSLPVAGALVRESDASVQAAREGPADKAAENRVVEAPVAQVRAAFQGTGRLGGDEVDGTAR